jgi:nitrogen fixation protein FixH
MNTSTASSSGRRRRPREITGRTVLICVVAFFGVVALVNGIMMRLAISTFGGLETESSYKAGLAFAREISASEAQTERHWSVTGKIGHLIDGQVSLEIAARDANGRPLAGYEATARLSHPTDRRLDHALVLSSTEAGRFSGKVDASSGQWDLVIELTKNDERMFRSVERIVLDAGGAR